MPAQAKTEPLEYLHLDSYATLSNAHGLLHDLGYRGTLTTTAGDSARIDMTMPDNLTIAASVGDVLLYKTSPAPMVVACETYNDFIAGYDIT